MSYSHSADTSPQMRLLTVQDYLDLKEELRARIVKLVPEIIQSAYFYGSIATGDVSPGLSDPDVYVIIKTEKGELPTQMLKGLFRQLWDLAIHPIYNQVWGVHWIHFDTEANVDKTLSNPLALLTFLYRSEFVAGTKLAFPKPDYDSIMKWMREFMAPADEKKQLAQWLLSTRVVQGPKGLFYLLDSTIFHLGAWIAMATRKFPKTHSESYRLLIDAVPQSETYVQKIAKIRGNWYENNDFQKILDVYLDGIDEIPKIEKELVERLYS
jgi:hypothetical protein